LANFSNGKQTKESLESDFPKTTFWETNILFFFLLALPSSVHPKILTRFYFIYFKVPRKISAQFDG